MRRLLHRQANSKEGSSHGLSTVTVVCIALLGILLFVLGANVTRHRAIRGDTGNQMPTDPADRMFIAQRAHGNAAEYVPTLIVLIIVCATLTDGWWLDALAIAAARRATARLRDADAPRRWPRTARSATSARWAPTSPASRSASPRSSPSHDVRLPARSSGSSGTATSSRGRSASSP